MCGEFPNAYIFGWGGVEKTAENQDRVTRLTLFINSDLYPFSSQIEISSNRTNYKILHVTLACLPEALRLDLKEPCPAGLGPQKMKLLEPRCAPDCWAWMEIRHSPT